MLLVVAEDLKHNGLALDVFDEGLGHLYRDLEGKYGPYLKVLSVHENSVLQAQPSAQIPAMASQDVLCQGLPEVHCEQF